MKSKLAMSVRNGVLVLVIAGSATAYAVKDTKNTYSDAISEASLTTTYALNRHLNFFKIDVEVHNGEATLSGQVDGEVEKDLAEQLALGIDGIQKVNNQLKIEDAQANRAKSDNKDSQYTFLDRVEDANITARVKSLLIWNENTSGLVIDVDTQNKVVNLSGFVDSSQQAKLAEQIAKNTDGVKEVKNSLQIDKGASKRRSLERNINDSWITGKIEASLLYNRGVDGTDIDVDTKNGIVTLNGYVEHKLEREKAITIAKRTSGVKEVNDKLTIK